MRRRSNTIGVYHNIGYKPIEQTEAYKFYVFIHMYDEDCKPTLLEAFI